ncbi:MAG: type II toxin-antitoxin system HicA family toxin [Planctomycetota bacterium]
MTLHDVVLWRLMKRRDLERHLSDHECRFDHHGGRHDIWLNPANGLDAAVPRHNEIKFGTARAICKQLDIPIPRGK